MKDHEKFRNMKDKYENTFQKNLENRKYAKEEKSKKKKKLKAKKVKLLNKNKQSLKSLDKKYIFLDLMKNLKLKKLKTSNWKKNL